MFFGKEGAIEDNDPDEQEKRVKYLELVSAAMILQNAIDISQVLQRLVARGDKIDRNTIPSLSPYLTEGRKRYGDFIVDLTNAPLPFEEAILFPTELIEN